MKNFVDHLMVLAMEECCELSQAVSKCLRFTPDHTPEGIYPTSNKDRVTDELIDLIAVAQLLRDEGCDLMPLLANNTYFSLEIVQRILIRKEHIKGLYCLSLGLRNE